LVCEAQGFVPVGGHGVTDELSSQVQEVATLGVTGEHEPLDSVNPKNPHTCCFVAVVGLVTDGLFQFALAYSAPARVAPLSEAEAFINDPKSAAPSASVIRTGAANANSTAMAPLSQSSQRRHNEAISFLIMVSFRERNVHDCRPRHADRLAIGLIARHCRVTGVGHRQ